MFAVLSQFRHITVFTLPALRGNTVQFFPVTAVIQRFYCRSSLRRCCLPKTATASWRSIKTESRWKKKDVCFVVLCLVVSRRDVTCRACSNMVDEEAIEIACTCLVFCGLGVNARNIKKWKHHAVWARDYLTKTFFDTFRHVWHNKTCCAE